MQNARHRHGGFGGLCREGNVDIKEGNVFNILSIGRQPVSSPVHHQYHQHGMPINIMDTVTGAHQRQQLDGLERNSGTIS